MNYTIKTYAQSSPEWFKDKSTRISGTLSFDLLKNGREYALQKAKEHAESSQKYSGPVSKWAQRGLDLEPKARELLGRKLGYDFEEVGFVISEDYENVGCSPDGVTFSDSAKTKIDEICEIKCFEFKHHDSCHESIDTHIMCQIQWNIWVTGAKCCYFVQYNPDYLDETQTPDGKRHVERVLYITKIEPDLAMQKAFKEALGVKDGE